MTPRQEITGLALALVAAILALLGCVAGEAREVDKAQARFVDERAVVVRVQTMCRSDAAGGAVCAPNTFTPATTTTSAP